MYKLNTYVKNTQYRSETNKKNEIIASRLQSADFVHEPRSVTRDWTGRISAFRGRSRHRS